MNRRRFLELSASGAVVAVLAQLSRKPAFGQATSTQESTTNLTRQFPPVPEFVRLDELLPNDEANLVNAIVVPENLLPRTDQEKVKVAVDFRSTFNPENPDVLLNDLWGYGESVKDAISRGQDVWLVMDIPDSPGQVSLDDLTRYFIAVAKEFSSTQISGKSRSVKHVIGNELNAQSKTRADDYIRWYAQVYASAGEAILSVAPSAELYPYAESYYDSGDTLNKVLAFIKLQPISGLCFHYYDDKTGIRERAEIYRQLAEKHGLPPTVHLLELGKPEKTKANFSVFDHQSVIVRNLVEALALVEEGIIETVFWHTAERVGDPNSHALLSYDTFGRLEPKPQFWTFQTMSKLFHHDVRWKELQLENGSTTITVTGVASSGDRSEVSWIRTRNSDGSVLSESPPELKVYPSSKLSLRRILRASLDKRE